MFVTSKLPLTGYSCASIATFYYRYNTVYHLRCRCEKSRLHFHSAQYVERVHVVLHLKTFSFLFLDSHSLFIVPPPSPCLLFFESGRHFLSQTHSEFLHLDPPPPFIIIPPPVSPHIFRLPDLYAFPRAIFHIFFNCNISFVSVSRAGIVPLYSSTSEYDVVSGYLFPSSSLIVGGKRVGEAIRARIRCWVWSPGSCQVKWVSLPPFIFFFSPTTGDSAECLAKK